MGDGLQQGQGGHEAGRWRVKGVRVGIEMGDRKEVGMGEGQ